MSRSKSLSLLALAILSTSPVWADSGTGAAHAAAQVSVSIPSMHGVDIPSRPSGSGVVLAANKSDSGHLSLPALRVMSSNGDGSIRLVRRVRDIGGTTVSNSTRTRAALPEDVTNATRQGAAGWTEIQDELDAPAVMKTSNQTHRVTVVYEVWSF
jgi:hypothetical protein